jgi:hypothetical protein
MVSQPRAFQATSTPKRFAISVATSRSTPSYVPVSLFSCEAGRAAVRSRIDDREKEDVDARLSAALSLLALALALVVSACGGATRAAIS